MTSVPWKDKQKIKAYQTKYRKLHRESIVEYSLKYRQINCVVISNKQKLRRSALKLQAYMNYGGSKCCWCGEDDVGTLSIDHIENNGNRHLDAKGYKIQSSRLYSWLKKHNYPKGFQILCFNCNYAKTQNNGVLPENRKNIHT